MDIRRDESYIKSSDWWRNKGAKMNPEKMKKIINTFSGQ